MKQYHKLKLVKDELIRSTSEYNQIVLPFNMQDVVYTEKGSRPCKVMILLARNV